MVLNTLGSFISYNAKTFPDKTAFVCGQVSRTFAEYNARVNRIINGLVKLGLQGGDRVGVLSTNRIELVEAHGACEKGGFIAVPLNFRYDRNDVEYVARDAELSAIFAGEEYRPLVEGLPIPHQFFFDADGRHGNSYERFLAASSTHEPQRLAKPDDIVYMMYTGGTTGRPKGVLLDQYGQVENAKTALIEAAVGPDDRLLTVMPLYHIGGKNFAIAHFHRACTNILVPNFNASDILSLFSSEGIACVLLAPTMIKMLVDELDEKPFLAQRLKNIYYSSAPMPVALLRQAITCFGRVFIQFYGLTESGPSGACLRKEDHLPDGTPQQQRRLASAGRAMAYNEISVVDEAGKELPPGQVGEVRIRATQVMRGYWRNEAATQEAMRDGWIYSGDLGEIDEDGYLYVVGRKKDVIISGGESIYPRELEELLNSHPAIKEVAVIGIPDDKWGEAVTALVALNEPNALSEDDIVEFCRVRLASYKKPRHVFFRDSLPRSSIGKILKSDLRQEFWVGRDRSI